VLTSATSQAKQSASRQKTPSLNNKMNPKEPVLTTQIELRRRFWPTTLFSLLAFSIALCHLPLLRAALLPQVLHEFSSNPRTPYAGLVQGSDGNLYGTATEIRSSDRPSIIFKLTTNGVFATLFSFPTTNGFAGADLLVQASDGDFYGTAYGLRKANDFGAFFKLTTNGVLTLLYSFVAGSTGAYPQGGLVQGADGNFYGTANSGGAYGEGAVFKVTTNGLLTTLASFNTTNGAYPSAGVIQGLDGNFYGTTASGGTNGSGVVFKLTAEGSLTALHSFKGSDGDSPETRLVQGTDGNLYGTTKLGGASGFGAIFKLSTNATFTLLHSFSGTDGAYPDAGPLQGDGNLYGTTSDGGANRWFGTIFKITTSGALTTLRSFNLSDGDYPQGTLAGSSATGFYGIMTGSGGYASGSSFQYSVASAFRITTNGTLTTLHYFVDPAGSKPGGLSRALNGDFYGVTSEGGTNELGTVFRFDPQGNFSSLFAFNGSNGLSPQAGLVQGADGNFYGTTTGGGVNDQGSIFKMTASGALTTLHSFNGTDGQSPQGRLVQGTDRLLYGTTYVGGSNDLGTVFKISTNGAFSSVASFNITNGTYPSTALVQGNDENFYGTAGNDLIYKLTPAGTLSALVTFNGANGSSPGGLALGADGNFYGVASSGGANGKGTIFKLTPAGNLTTLLSFDGTNGAHPQAALVLGTDGNHYGTTSQGGTAGYGTAFMITPSGTLTTLLSFGPADPQPISELVQGADGNFYGSSRRGGSGVGGTLFRLVSQPLITLMPLPNHTLQLIWNSFTNGFYRLEYKSTLSDAAWLELAPNVTATNSATAFSDTLGTNIQRYYRVILSP
jgi:uncharacterized repeat protein (TIGR03803 family)